MLRGRGRPPLWLGLVIVMGLAALAGAGREVTRWLRSERITGAAEVIDGDSLRVGGRELRLDVDATDRYGRGLATCRAGSVEINRTLVNDGMAVAYGRYEAEEAAARAARRGVWATRFQRPADWRASHPRTDP